MKILTQNQRLEYWKYQCAALSFIRAKEVIDYLISNEDSPIIYQLITSVYVLYGRPFKQSGRVRISEELVPHEYSEEHSFLIGLRDKMFAHVDIEGLAEKDISQLSKILIRIIEDEHAQAGMASLLPIGFQYERTRDLCQYLCDTCDRKAEKILIEAMDGDCPPLGIYEVDVSKDETHLIKKATFPEYKSSK